MKKTILENNLNLMIFQSYNLVENNAVIYLQERKHYQIQDLRYPPLGFGCIEIHSHDD